MFRYFVMFRNVSEILKKKKKENYTIQLIKKSFNF